MTDLTPSPPPPPSSPPPNHRRRQLLTALGAAGGLAAAWKLPSVLHEAASIPADVRTGTLADVDHVVILMQENRSFDHYFGGYRGVRGFGDRFPIPLPSGKPVWYQSDGQREITPFRFDRRTMNAALIPSTPHNFPDAQGAWRQGMFGDWAKFKTPNAMGYYTRDEAPFQYALADAFTLCDHYFCAVQSGTDPNRIVYWSGSINDPALRDRGINCTDADSEPVNLRCWVKGRWPDPGYTYQGTALKWPTIPEVLEAAGVSWRIYQNPNDNWTGAMHGCLAFAGFRNATPDSAIYRQGMSHWSLDDLARDVEQGRLPAVSWVLPGMMQSEHPGAPSSPHQGGHFIEQILIALTRNPAVWARTVVFLCYDENDGLFDHLPPPAVPSYDAQGRLMGGATLPVAGMYFQSTRGEYLSPEDTISGNLRPFGMGPRVPMFVISPWSRGGWVNSQVFDHTSVGMFLEKRFHVTIPAISPWHRAVAGDLTTTLDFVHPNDPKFPPLPDQSHWQSEEARSATLPHVEAPPENQALYQEAGTRFSRALPYALDAHCRVDPRPKAGSRYGRLSLTFDNTGSQGAVFHVYDRHNLHRIPRRYTVEAGKSFTDEAWELSPPDSGYALSVFGPNGFFRAFEGKAPARGTPKAPRPREPGLEMRVSYVRATTELVLTIRNRGSRALVVTVRSNAYRRDGPWQAAVGAGAEAKLSWSLVPSFRWYDFTATAPGCEQRFAGRMETGEDGVSDPAMGTGSVAPMA